MRAAAAEALGGIRAVSALDDLVAVLKDEYRDARAAAATSLGKIGDSRAIDPLMAAFSDENHRAGSQSSLNRGQDVRAAAVTALGQIGDPRAADFLIGALDESDRHIHEAAVEALGQIGAPAIDPLLVKAGASVHKKRAAAVEALGQISDARTFEPLVAALEDQDDGVRAAAAAGLGKLADPRAVEPLIAALQRGGESVRSAAARALGQIGDPRAVEPLAAVRGERWWAVTALGQIGAPALDPLIAALRDDDRRVRGIAADALGAIGDTRAIPALASALGDPGETATALAKIGNAQAIEALVDALKSEHWSVRRAAAEALVAAYRSGKLDRGIQAQVLKRGSAITESHYDERDGKHRDEGFSNSDCHTDQKAHTDRGIGVAFPGFGGTGGPTRWDSGTPARPTAPGWPGPKSSTPKPAQPTPGWPGPNASTPVRPAAPGWQAPAIVTPSPRPATTPGAVPGWAPTHLAPAAGMAVWAAPDGRLLPVAQIPGNTELVAEASAGLWVQVRVQNGWRGWVDGRLLTARMSAESTGATGPGAGAGAGMSVASEGGPAPAGGSAANTSASEDVLSTAGIEAMLRAHLERLYRSSGDNPGANGLKTLTGELLTEPMLSYAVAAIGAKLPASHAPNSDGRPFANWYVAVTVCADLDPAIARASMPGGYLALMNAVTAPAYARPGYLNVAHWVYCCDGLRAGAHLTMIPNPNRPRISPSLIAQDFLSAVERRQLNMTNLG